MLSQNELLALAVKAVEAQFNDDGSASHELVQRIADAYGGQVEDRNGTFYPTGVVVHLLDAAVLLMRNPDVNAVLDQLKS